MDYCRLDKLPSTSTHRLLKPIRIFLVGDRLVGKTSVLQFIHSYLSCAFLDRSSSEISAVRVHSYTPNPLQFTVSRLASSPLDIQIYDGICNVEEFESVRSQESAFDIVIFVTDFKEQILSPTEENLIRTIHQCISNCKIPTQTLFIVNKCDSMVFDPTLNDLVFTNQDNTLILLEFTKRLRDILVLPRENLKNSFLPFSALRYYQERYSNEYLLTKYTLVDKNESTETLKGTGHYVIVECLQDILDEFSIRACTYLESRIRSTSTDPFWSTRFKQLFCDLLMFRSSGRTYLVDLFWSEITKYMTTYTEYIDKIDTSFTISHDKNYPYLKEIADYIDLKSVVGMSNLFTGMKTDSEIDLINLRISASCKNFVDLYDELSTLEQFPKQIFDEILYKIVDKLVHIYDQFLSNDICSAENVLQNPRDLYNCLVTIKTFRSEKYISYIRGFLDLICRTSRTNYRAEHEESITQFLLLITEEDSIMPKDILCETVPVICTLLMHKQTHMATKQFVIQYDYLIQTKLMLKTILGSFSTERTSERRNLFSILTLLSEVTAKNLNSCLSQRGLIGIGCQDVDVDKIHLLFDVYKISLRDKTVRQSEYRLGVVTLESILVSVLKRLN